MRDGWDGVASADSRGASAAAGRNRDGFSPTIVSCEKAGMVWQALTRVAW
jgi:hypothetical protein